MTIFFPEMKEPSLVLHTWVVASPVFYKCPSFSSSNKLSTLSTKSDHGNIKPLYRSENNKQITALDNIPSKYLTIDGCG